MTSELTFNGECRVNPELVAFELQIYWFGLLLAQEGEPHSTAHRSHRASLQARGPSATHWLALSARFSRRTRRPQSARSAGRMTRSVRSPWARPAPNLRLGLCGARS